MGKLAPRPQGNKTPTNDELPDIPPKMRRELFDGLRKFGGDCGKHCLDHPKPQGLFSKRLGKK